MRAIIPIQEFSNKIKKNVNSMRPLPENINHIFQSNTIKREYKIEFESIPFEESKGEKTANMYYKIDGDTIIISNTINENLFNTNKMYTEDEVKNKIIAPNMRGINENQAYVF